MNLSRNYLVRIILLSLFWTINAFATASNVVFLDVRTPQEYSEGHLEKALNVDFYGADFEKELLKLDKNKNYKLYCRSGNRSQKAMDKMKELGFKNIENLGGYLQIRSNFKTCEGSKC